MPRRTVVRVYAVLALIAVGLASGCPRIGAPTKGLEVATFQNADTGANNIVCSPDGTLLAIFGEDSKVRLCDVVAKREKIALRSNAKALYCAAFCPTGRKLAFGGSERVFGAGAGVVEVWDTMTGVRLLSLRGHPKRVEAVVFSADGNTLYTAIENAVWRWDLSTSQGRPILDVSRTNATRDKRFSPDAKSLVVVDGDSLKHTYAMTVWDLAAGTEKARFADTKNVESLAISPSSNLIATGLSGKIRLWESSSAGEPVVLSRKWPVVKSLCFSNDGRTLAAGGIDLADDRGEIVFWDIETRKEILHFNTGQDYVIESLTFSPNDLFLFTGDGHGYVKMWDLAKMRQANASEGENQQGNR